MLGTCGGHRIVLALALVVSCSETSPVGVVNDAGDLGEADRRSPEIVFSDSTVFEDVWPDSEQPDRRDDADRRGPPDNTVPPDVKPDLEDIAGPDTRPDIVDVKPETDFATCIPKCGGKSCGPDTCGGVCGFCQYGFLCDTGTCVESICQTVCKVDDSLFRECGSDGCGGYCGFCMGSTYCGTNGFCYQGSCQGSCGSKSCGDDGCGHSCGNCQPGQLCTAQGQCIAHPCGTVTYKGICQDKYVLNECVLNKLIVTNCKAIQGNVCGWNDNVGKYSCLPETTCTPQCTLPSGKARECGPDSCWGVCGICPVGWGCAEGLCNPAPGAECAWIDGIVGSCVGKVRWFCDMGKLYRIDCGAMGDKFYCAWDTSQNAGAGGFNCLFFP